MNFEQTIQKAATVEKTVSLSLGCIKLCNTALRNNLNQNDIKCLKTCGYNQKFLQDLMSRVVYEMIEKHGPKNH